jgi:hypothetical protein
VKPNKVEARALLDAHVPAKGYQPERLAQEELMIRCMAFFIGKQYFVQNGALLQDLAPVSPHEVRYRANIILPAVQRAAAKIAGVQGRFRVAPKSGSPKDRYTARISDKVLDHCRETNDYQDAKEEAVIWAAICGSGFLRTTWDPTRGEGNAKRYYNDEAGKLIMPRSEDERMGLERAGQFEDLAQGDIEFEPVSPFSFHYDWDSRRSIRDCQWVAEANLVGIASVANKYNLQEKNIKPNDTPDGLAIWDEALAFMSSGNSIRGGTTGFGYKPKQTEKDGRVLVTSYFHRPTKKYPRGLYIVRLGEEILFVKDNPYRDTAPLPYTKIDWVKVPGRFMGIGLVEQLLSPQFQYNESRAKLTQFQNVAGMPPLFNPSGSGVPSDVLLESGVTYDYNPSVGAPTYGQAPQYPPEVANNAAMARAEVDTISSQADPDVSGAPGQMRSGEALRLWFDERDKPLSMVQRASLKLDRDTGRMALSLCRMNYTEERTLSLLGDTGEFQYTAFKGADLHNDVRIIGEPSNPDSVNAFKAEVSDLIQLGAMDPANNKEHWRLLVDAQRWNTFDEASQDWARDKENQEREIAEMVADPAKWMEQPYPVLPFEEHDVHAKTLARFMKGDDFRSLDTATQSVLFQHYMLHVQQVEAAQQAAMEQAEAMKGTPGAKGKASQPSR